VKGALPLACRSDGSACCLQTRKDMLLERGRSMKCQDVKEVNTLSEGGYWEFTDAFGIPRADCNSDRFPEGESRMKQAAA